MKKEYLYFIAYIFNQGNGNVVLEVNSKIDSIEIIRELEKRISNEFNYTNTVITNFILLKEKNNVKSNT